MSQEEDVWVVVCGDSEPVRHELLDVALIEAIRSDGDVLVHSTGTDYGEWTRRLADGIQRAFLSRG